MGKLKRARGRKKVAQCHIINIIDNSHCTCVNIEIYNIYQDANIMS